MTPTRDPVLVIAVMLGVLLFILFSSLAKAHDPKRPELDKWFDNLTAAGSLCCTGRDYKVVDDSDWDTQDNHYRVRLDGKWFDVPANAVVKEPNRFGRALVWVNRNYGVALTIRCFLPGTMT